MTSFSYQLKTIKRLKVPEGISRRYDCPFCGHHNTLGVSNINGIIEWNCFSASCGAKGIYDEGCSVDGIKERLSSTPFEVNRFGRNIPDLVTAISKPEHIRWLESVNSYEALQKRLVDIVYSPADDRILFGVSYHNTVVGYSGRRIDYDSDFVPKPRVYGPKWIKYGDTTHLFTCGTGSIGVLVEDAPSACAVGIIPEYTGLSLLGTTLTSQHKMDILKYKSIIVCLDPDAASKGVSLASKINGIRPSVAKIIDDDLKYFQPNEIKEMLR